MAENLELTDKALNRLEDAVQRTQQGFFEHMQKVLETQGDAFLRQGKTMLLETAEELVRRHADEILKRVKETVLATAEEIVRQPLEALLGRTRAMLTGLVDDLVQKHGPGLLGRLHDTLVESVRDMVSQQMGPFTEQGRALLREGAGLVRQQVDQALGQFREEVKAPLVDLVRFHVPEYTRRTSNRVIDYTLAITLFCLATIFLLVGVVHGLQELGVSQAITYILGGLGALGGGLVFLRLYKQAWAEFFAAWEARRARDVASPSPPPQAIPVLPPEKPER
jgi:hypothetical protein